MEFVIKAAMLAIVTGLIALLIKKSNPEIALLLAIAAVISLLVMSAEIISKVKESIVAAVGVSNISPAVITPVLKCVGIGIISRIATDICKDAGQSSIASAVELVGVASALYISMPIMRSLLQMIGGLL
jgi:Stage III sporulation protein AC/AD protein family.